MSSFIAKLSQRVQMQSNSGAVSAKKDDKFFHKTFPNFVWLLRDALLSIPQDCKDLKGYFLTKVLNKQESSATSSDGAEQVADSILRFFPEFDAFRLPPPAFDLETMKNLKKNRDKVNPAFWTGLKDFKLLLRPILAPKRTFNDGEFVTGEGLAALVQLYTEAINTPGCIPNVQGAWDTFVNTKCYEAKQAAVLTYDALLTSQLSDVLPCDSDMIRVIHSVALDESEDQFMKEIAGFSTDTVELHAKELKASIEQKLTSWHSENEKVTRKLCEDLLGQLKSCHLDPVLRQLQGEAGAKLSFDDIIGAYGRIKGDYDNNASGAKHVIAAVFSEFHKELNKEKEQNLSWLSRLKDFEQQRMNDLAAKAYVEKEKKSLQEDRRRLLQENVEQKKQMELLIKNMEEDKKRFYEQMDDERKKQRVQTEDLIAAGRKEAQEEMQVFIAENNDLRNRNMEMQKASEDNMKMIKKLSDLIASKENEKEEIRQQMKDEAAENTRAIIQEIDHKHRGEIKALRDEMTAKVNEAIANYPSAPWTGRVARPVKIDEEIETTDAGIGEVEKPGFLDLVKGLIPPVLTFAAPYVAPIVGPIAARAAEALSKCSVM